MIKQGKYYILKEKGKFIFLVMCTRSQKKGESTFSAFILDSSEKSLIGTFRDMFSNKDNIWKETQMYTPKEVKELVQLAMGEDGIFLDKKRYTCTFKQWWKENKKK